VRAFRTEFRPRGSSRRRTLLLLIAVIPLIAGILAMHSLGLEEDQASLATPTVSAVSVTGLHSHATEGTSTPVAVPEACGSVFCDGPRAMTAVECILALASALSLLMLIGRSRGDTLLAVARGSGLVSAAPPRDSVTRAPAPSLTVLSVSRT